MGTIIETYLSVFSVVISLIALSLTYLRLNNDNPKVGFSYVITGDAVRVVVFNTGKRPIFIKSVGIYDWTMGSYIFGANKSVNSVVNEAESISVEEPYNLGAIWKIKSFVAIDHNNKKWVSSNSQMESLYEIAHFKPIEGTDYFTAGGNSKKHEKASKKRDDSREVSIKKYRTFAKKNHFEPRV